MASPNKLNNTHRKTLSYGYIPDWGAYYKHRNMLHINASVVTDRPQLSIMTYNLLSNCSKHRYRALDGSPMSQCRHAILVHEIGTYNPDVICLQEVAIDKLMKFRMRLHRLGYTMVVLCHSPTNGLAICYKTELFKQVLLKVENYSDAMPPSHPRSRHCAMFMSLEFTEIFLDGYARPLRDGLIVANTHLPVKDQFPYWKTQQTVTLMNFIRTFAAKCSSMDSMPDPYILLAGDFNTAPADHAYRSLVSKPFQFSPTDKPILLLSETSAISALNNLIDLRAISLYSAGYKHVHPRNAGIDNDRNEPEVSFWGPSWQGLCDYIFVICDWNGDDRTSVDTLEELTDASGVKLLALLHMPRPENLSESLPAVGFYPSDHLCMMADVELM